MRQRLAWLCAVVVLAGAPAARGQHAEELADDGAQTRRALRGPGLPPAPDRDLGPGGAEVLRSGDDPALRLQPRRGVPILREGRAARSEGLDAALGNGARDRRQLQRSRARGGAADEGARRGRSRPRALAARAQERARLRRGPGPALRRRPLRGRLLCDRQGGSRPRVSRRDACAVAEVPGRPGRGHALCGERDEPASLEALHRRWDARGGNRGDRRGARVGPEARSEPPRRQSLLHPRRRGLAASRACAGVRRAPGDAGAFGGAPRAHARARLLSHGRLPRGGEVQRGGGGGRPKVHPGERRVGDLSDDVLHAQPALRVGGRGDGRPPRRREEGGRRPVRGRAARRRPRADDGGIPPAARVRRASDSRPGTTCARWRTRAPGCRSCARSGCTRAALAAADQRDLDRASACGTPTSWRATPCRPSSLAGPQNSGASPARGRDRPCSTRGWPRPRATPPRRWRAGRRPCRRRTRSTTTSRPLGTTRCGSHTGPRFCERAARSMRRGCSAPISRFILATRARSWASPRA